ncbi:LysR family transcriptional regulator [Roseovarius aestuarii]|nr:LysR family transcriptional regulator [Roseovarius aestuarii]
MAIKIEMLRCFQAVADHGSLAGAAEALGRTPSAVSMMLRQFEDHIGAPLFETARKSRLTPLGTLIRTEAARELSHFHRTIAAIEGLARAESGNIRISCTPSVAQTIMPPILRQFMQACPGVHIDLSDTDSATVQRDLIEDRADIGLASLAPMPGFDRRLLFADPYGVVCPVNHPLAQNWHELTWADLEGLGFIANGLCQQIPDEGFRPILASAHLMVRNTASILSMVRAGAGVTILPQLAILPEFLDLEFLPLATTRTRREVWMVTLPHAELSPAVKGLADCIMGADIKVTP